MISKALQKLNIAQLNEMQEMALKTIKNEDSTILLSATGSGKTLAFLLPLLTLLQADQKEVQALILVPSRELALQIEQVFRQISTGFKVNCCYGGHATRIEKNNLAHPPAVLIGTPGRIAYHIRNQNFNTQNIRTLILDEFDKSLELGFQDEMWEIIRQIPQIKKRILVSATAMDNIPEFAGLVNPATINFLDRSNNQPDITVKAVQTTAAGKVKKLFSLLCQIGNKPTLVFCNHREAVERISEFLFNKEFPHAIYHGGLEQADRELALLKFRNGTHRLLITTDLASRGLDIPEIETVIHYQLPHTEEAFVHRNGRTARMHAKGNAYLLIAEEEYEPPFLKASPVYEEVSEENTIPPRSDWSTLYIGAGKKDKINKIDIVGLLLQKGGLQKEELGLIEVADYDAYAAVKSSKVETTLKRIRNEKIKNKKVKIDISR
jgi:superfamily II DNA/RNA helicase